MERAAQRSVQGGVVGHIAQDSLPGDFAGGRADRGRLDQWGKWALPSVGHRRGAQVLGEPGGHHETDVEQSAFSGEDAAEGDSGIGVGRRHGNRSQRVGCLGLLHQSLQPLPRRHTKPLQVDLHSSHSKDSDTSG